jgi:hypothetical protein
VSEPAAPAIEEAWTDTCLLAFDGRVLEVFGFPGGEQSLRFHVANLDLTLSGPDRDGSLDATLMPLRGGGGLRLQVSAARRPAVEPLLERVSTAIVALRHQ